MRFRSEPGLNNEPDLSVRTSVVKRMMYFIFNTNNRRAFLHIYNDWLFFSKISQQMKKNITNDNHQIHNDKNYTNS